MKIDINFLRFHINNFYMKKRNKMFECVCGNNFLEKSKYSGHIAKCKDYRNQRSHFLSLIDIEEMSSLYLNDKKSVNELKDIFGIKYHEVQLLLKQYGIKLRNIKDSCTQERTQKLKSIFLEKYGVENPSQLEEIKIKKAETTFKNFGVENPFQNIDIIEHIQKINEIKRPESLAKAKKTNLEKYGAENIYASEYGKNRIKTTMLERYGVSNVANCPVAKEKAHRTKVERYGENYHFLLMTQNSLKTKISKSHYKIFNFLKDIGENPQIEYRILKYSVDIFIERINLGIEIFGDYWHANPRIYLPTDKMKTDIAENVWAKDKKRIEDIQTENINMIIFWEYDIIKNFEMVSFKIASLLGKHNGNS